MFWFVRWQRGGRLQIYHITKNADIQRRNTIRAHEQKFIRDLDAMDSQALL